MPYPPRLKAFLDLIAWSEGTSRCPVTKADGYDVIVSGPDGWETFEGWAEHPFAGRPPKLVRAEPPLHSTAAGRYQLLYRWWTAYKARLRLSDFSPASQDAVAAQQMRERGATDMVAAGRVGAAIAACSNIWASLPGNSYGQGGHTAAALETKYQELLAAAETAAGPKET